MLWVPWMGALSTKREFPPRNNHLELDHANSNTRLKDGDSESDPHSAFLFVFCVRL